jgi:hypothetical protein
MNKIFARTTGGCGGGGGVIPRRKVTTTETNVNEPTLSVDIMKSTDSDTILKLSKFIFSCFELEERLKQLEAGNAGSHQLNSSSCK